MILDWSENAAISRMLANPQNLDPAQVEFASTLTMIKSIGSLVTESILLLMFAAYLDQPVGRRRKARAPEAK